MTVLAPKRFDSVNPAMLGPAALEALGREHRLCAACLHRRALTRLAWGGRR
ncbi:MAG: hypothetical protein ABR569_05870 [Gaiellaceae bacterium]